MQGEPYTIETKLGLIQIYGVQRVTSAVGRNIGGAVGADCNGSKKKNKEMERGMGVADYEGDYAKKDLACIIARLLFEDKG